MSAPARSSAAHGARVKTGLLAWDAGGFEERLRRWCNAASAKTARSASIRDPLDLGLHVSGSSGPPASPACGRAPTTDPSEGGDGPGGANHRVAGTRARLLAAPRGTRPRERADGDAGRAAPGRRATSPRRAPSARGDGHWSALDSAPVSRSTIPRRSGSRGSRVLPDRTDGRCRSRRSCCGRACGRGPG